MRDSKRASFQCDAGMRSFLCKKFFYKIIQGKMVLADLNRGVEFVDKLLFMESLVTGWKMLWENGGKEVFLFHDFSMHYPPGYQ